MHVFSKILFVFILLSSLLGWGQQQVPYYAGQDDGANIYTGYFISRNLLDDTFFQYGIVTRFFMPWKVSSPYQINAAMMLTFAPIVDSLEAYIIEQKKGIMSHCEDKPEKCSTTFASVNGITERELAMEITKASFCFGTDPFVVTSKIRQESRFDMTAVSNTGAVGLTQLTTPGLEEILDQLGHRGAKYAYLDNKEFLASAVACYTQNRLDKALANFPEIKTYEGENKSIGYNGDTIKDLKAWVLPSRKADQIKNKRSYIQRQLFLGQILLKIYLAYSKKVQKNQTTTKHYEAALRMFNGDDARVKYAKEVMKYSRQAQAL